MYTYETITWVIYEINKKDPLNGGRKNKLKEQNIFYFKKFQLSYPIFIINTKVFN
jgi:hypothetical protein